MKRDSFIQSVFRQNLIQFVQKHLEFIFSRFKGTLLLCFIIKVIYIYNSCSEYFRKDISNTSINWKTFQRVQSTIINSTCIDYIIDTSMHTNSNNMSIRFHQSDYKVNDFSLSNQSSNVNYDYYTTTMLLFTFKFYFIHVRRAKKNMCDGNLIQPSLQYYIGFVSKRKLVCHNVTERRWFMSDYVVISNLRV